MHPTSSSPRVKGWQKKRICFLSLYTCTKTSYTHISSSACPQLLQFFFSWGVRAVIRTMTIIVAGGPNNLLQPPPQLRKPSECTLASYDDTGSWIADWPVSI